LVFSGFGNDIVNAGSGNDIISDKGGNDRYIFNGNFGQDTLFDNNGIDEIIMDLNPLDVIFSKNNTDLEITAKNSSDKLIIKNWVNSTNKIETFVIGGKKISMNKIDELVQAMASFGYKNENISWETELGSKKDDVNQLISSYYNTTK